MKVKSKETLEGYANNIFAGLEADLKPCEMVFVMSKVSEMIARYMLQNEV
jgi:hypothetical protein